MEKEEILAKSRKENKNRDIAELAVINHASRVAAIVGMLLCCVISLLDWNFRHTLNCGCWMIDFGILSTLFFVKFGMRRRTHELLIAIGYLLAFAFFCYGYIFGLVGHA